MLRACRNLEPLIWEASKTSCRVYRIQIMQPCKLRASCLGFRALGWRNLGLRFRAERLFTSKGLRNWGVPSKIRDAIFGVPISYGVQ